MLDFSKKSPERTVIIIAASILVLMILFLPFDAVLFYSGGSSYFGTAIGFAGWHFITTTAAPLSNAQKGYDNIVYPVVVNSSLLFTQIIILIISTISALYVIKQKKNKENSQMKI